MRVPNGEAGNQTDCLGNSRIVPGVTPQFFQITLVTGALLEYRCMIFVRMALSEQEELMASLGVPEIFLANVQRLNENRNRRTSINIRSRLFCLLLTFG
jgi:hypothetical protein